MNEWMNESTCYCGATFGSILYTEKTYVFTLPTGITQVFWKVFGCSRKMQRQANCFKWMLSIMNHFVAACKVIFIWSIHHGSMLIEASLLEKCPYSPHFPAFGLNTERYGVQNMNIFLCQTLINLVYLNFIMVNNDFGEEPATFII